MKLFFDEIQKAKSRDRLARIDDVNAGFAGGKHAEKLKHDLES